MIKSVSGGNAPQVVITAPTDGAIALTDGAVAPTMPTALESVRSSACRPPARPRSRSAECLRRASPGPMLGPAVTPAEPPPLQILSRLLMQSARVHRCNVRGDTEGVGDQLDVGFDVCVSSTLSRWPGEYVGVWRPTCALIHEIFLDLQRHLKEPSNGDFRAYRTILSRETDGEQIEVKLRHSLRAPCQRLSPENIELLLHTLQARRPYWLLTGHRSWPNCTDALIHRLLTFLREQGRPDIDAEDLITQHSAAYERGGR